MRRLIWLGALALLSGGVARADAFSLYLQGHGGLGADNASELMPGGESPSLGPVLGLEGGAHVMFLGGYITRDAYLHGGSVTRAILGLDERIGLAGFRFTLRAGGGFIYEDQGVLERDPTAPSESGLVARAGAALEHTVSSRLLLGVGVDAEYFALRVPGSNDLRTGTDLFGSLRLTFEIGL